MATLAVDGNELVVRLSALEKIGALRGNIRVPLASVRAVRVSETPWSELRGVRAPGTGLPKRARPQCCCLPYPPFATLGPPDLPSRP